MMKQCSIVKALCRYFKVGPLLLLVVIATILLEIQYSHEILLVTHDAITAISTNNQVDFLPGTLELVYNTTSVLHCMLKLRRKHLVLPCQRTKDTQDGAATSEDRLLLNWIF
jgi:hypothetical protein